MTIVKLFTFGLLLHLCCWCNCNCS